MRNEGKVFEDDFKASIPDDVYYVRQHDSSIGFDIENSPQRFALKSKYDAILCKNGFMFCLELKSTKEKRLSFKGSNPEIQPKQVENLLIARRKGGAEAGLIFNFRTEEETYYVRIEDFVAFTESITKKSVNIKDVRSFGIPLGMRKLKVHYRYDTAPILNFAAF
jgi:penicillin-binding protein-related factor A (putative recombinase)